VRSAPAALALFVGLVVMAGCGSSSSTSSSAESSTPAASTPTTTSSATETSASGSEASSGAAETVKLEAASSGELKYNTTSLSAKAGKVSIDFTNSSSTPHNVTVESSSGTAVGNTETFAGGSKTLALTLKAGTYKFFCSVPGHRMAGMEGTLTVK
jgi:plastocyanin